MGGVSQMTRIAIKRVYDPIEDQDGMRILVDRIWPRGKTKESVACQLWARDITPSTELRRAFHAHHVDGLTFATRYQAELASNPAFSQFAETVSQALEHGNVTLLTAAQLVEHGHCNVLVEALERAIR